MMRQRRVRRPGFTTPTKKGATHAFCERIAQRRARLPRLRAFDRYNAPHPQQRRGIGYQSDRYIDAGVVDDALIA
jgi:hypothetical protein